MGALRSPALAPRDAITQPHTFRFFDVDLRLETDSSAFIAAFDTLYVRLRVAASAARGTGYAATFRSGAGPPATLTLDGVDYAVTASPRLLPLLVDVVATATLAQVRSHHLYHGATLAHGDRACLIVGASGFGKTTLALALAQRGLRLLSDELGAVTASGRVSPFARTVRLRPPTPALLDLPPATVRTDGHGRLLHDAAHTGAEPTSPPPKLTHLFILDHSPDHASGAAGECGSRILLAGAPSSLERALHRMPGVAAVSHRMAGNVRLSEVITASTAPPATIVAIRRRCVQARVLVLDVTPVAAAQPVFAATPQVASIPTAAALLATLPHLIGGPLAALRTAAVTGASPPAAAMMATLAGAFSPVRCFRLQPGPPGATADRILALMDES